MQNLIIKYLESKLTLLYIPFLIYKVQHIVLLPHKEPMIAGKLYKNYIHNGYNPSTT